jgi:hypothetical protein
MDMRFGTWNIQSLFRVGSLMTVSRELSRYRLNLVGAAGGQMGGQWQCTSRGIRTLYGKGNENHELGTGFLCIREWEGRWEVGENCITRSCIIIKSRRMRWVGHVERMGEKRNVYRL